MHNPYNLKPEEMELEAVADGANVVVGSTMIFRGNEMSDDYAYTHAISIAKSYNIELKKNLSQKS